MDNSILTLTEESIQLSNFDHNKWLENNTLSQLSANFHGIVASASWSDLL